MATIVTRAGKGSALTYAEADANFTNLNTDKVETSAIGTTVQPYSANLTEFATVNPTAAGLALLDDADASAQRTTLGLGTAATTNSTDYATAAQGALADTAVQPEDIGVSVQAYSANLDEYAAVNPTTAGLALLDDVDASAQRTTLGLGTAATTASTDYATAAQGAKADSALQSSDIGTSIQAYDSNLTSFVGAFTLPTVDGTSGQTLVTNGAGTLSFSSAGSGSVTSVSVVSSNGLAGTVANATTTPAITLSTTITGLLKGNGTAISAASAGTDYLAPAAIGTTVQSYDSNLTSFVNTFTLPTTDSTSGYVLSTDGAGNLSFVAQSGGGGSGTVTSVALAAPTGLTVSGSPVTTSGTLTLSYTAGYSIPTDASQSNWNTAYSWGNHATAGYALNSNIGITIQPYDADTAKYDDATANFTGTLQNNGSNVVVDSDIGTNVLAYDSNLQGFVNTFTLPTTDSTSGYVLSTNGSGILSWVAQSGSSMVYPNAGIAVSTGSAWGTSLSAPTGAIVGTSDTQTLTNKTLTNPTIDGTIIEETVAFTTSSTTLTITPANGSIQTITLDRNITTVSVSNFVNGNGVTLMIADGTAYTITWGSSVTWVGGSVPILSTSGYTVVELWEANSVVYGSFVGYVA